MTRKEKALMKIIGSNIKWVRECHRLSQAEIGKILNLNQSAICRIESGNYPVTPYHLQVLSDLHECNVSYFLHPVVPK